MDDESDSDSEGSRAALMDDHPEAPLALLDQEVTASFEVSGDSDGSSEESEGEDKVFHDELTVEEVPKRATGRGKAQVQGIASWKNRYMAHVSMGSLLVRTRRVQDLTVALDFLASLTLLKQRTCHSVEGPEFESCFLQGYREMLGEMGENAAESLGLMFGTSLRFRFILLHTLHTPFTGHLETALLMWRQFRALKLELLDPKSGKVHGHLLNYISPAALEDFWSRFCDTYVACWNSEEITVNRRRARRMEEPAEIRAKLAGLKRSHLAIQESRFSMWNLRRMRQEDTRLRAGELQKCERRLEAWNRRQMRTEERRQRVLERGARQRPPRSSKHGLEALPRVVERWREHETKRRHRRTTKIIYYRIMVLATMYSTVITGTAPVLHC